MTLTEEEAREKWCPIMAYKHDGNGADCIASRCMAWRWEQISTPKYKGPTDKGFCGIAGRPE